VRTRAFVGCVAFGFGLVTIAASSAGAASTPTSTTAAATPPGLLVVTDLPGTFVDAAPTTDTTFSALVVDPKACTETPVPIAGLTGAQSVVFGRTGTATPVAVSESVVSFPSARLARAAFAQQSKSAKAGVACGSVGFVPPGSTAPISNVAIAAVKSPLSKSTSFATSASPTPATVTNFVTFVQGPSLVTVGATAGPDGLSAADLKTVVGHARQRLGS